MTGPNTLLGQAADAARISATGLQRMRTLAHKLRNGWCPTDESDINDICCMLPGFEDIAARLADDAAERLREARDIIAALIEHGNNPRNPNSVKVCDRARAFLGEEK